MKKNSLHFDGVQILRFVAALLVVICHSFFYASERLGTSPLAFDNGSRGVDVFFTISGFVMIVSSRNLIGDQLGWAKFALQRLVRILPMYWLATTFKVVIMLLASVFSGEILIHATLEIRNIIGSYFFIPYIKNPGHHVEPLLGVGWTLIFEMFFYFLFSLALFLRINIYAFVGAVLMIFATLSTFRPINYPTWMFLLNPVVLEFFLGMMVGYLTLRGLIINTKYAILFSILALISILFTPIGLLPEIVVSGIPSAILVYSFVSLEPFLKNKVPKIILFFGAASYSLYLSHPIFAPLVPTILNKLDIHLFSLSIILSIMFSLIIGAIIYLFIELKINAFIKKRTFSYKK